MSTIPSFATGYGPADAGVFPPGVGVNPSTLQSLYAQIAPSGAVGDVAGAAGAGASGGPLSSLLGRIPSASNIAAGGIEWPGLRAFAGEAAPPLIASQLATLGINSALPSSGTAGDVRQVLGDAATGAGVGAAAGSIVPGIGTGIGAAIGGAAGGIYGGLQSLFGDQQPTTQQTNDQYKTSILSAAQQLGVDPAQYGAAWDLLTKSGADPKQLSVQLSQQLLQDAAQTKQQNQAIAMEAQQRQVDQKFALALQAQAQEFFAPYTNNIVNAGNTQGQLLMSLASQLPSAYRGIMENQAQQSIGQSVRLANAYAAQTALIPGQFMAQAELKRQTQLQQLQYQQQVIAAQQARSSGASGGGYNGLVQQLTQQPQGQTQPTG